MAREMSARTVAGRRARALGVVAVAMAVAACGSTAPAPVREAEAVGTVVAVDGDAASGVLVAFEPDPGYEYFEGTTFPVGDGDLVGGTRVQELRDGARIEVWVVACAESFPVQCDVEAARVVD